MKIGKEDSELISLFDWIRLQPHIEPYAWHSANERKCSPLQGAILKRKGVKSGVSDICLMIPRGNYHGAFIEMKVGNNKPTPNQLKFMEQMTLAGYYCTWQIGFEGCKKAIQGYLAGEHHAEETQAS